MLQMKKVIWSDVSSDCVKKQKCSYLVRVATTEHEPKTVGRIYWFRFMHLSPKQTHKAGATDYVPFYYKSLFIPYAFNRWRQRFTLYSSGFTKVTEFTSQLVMENSHFWQVGIYMVQVGFQEAMKKDVVSEKNCYIFILSRLLPCGCGCEAVIGTAVHWAEC